MGIITFVEFILLFLIGLGAILFALGLLKGIQLMLERFDWRLAILWFPTLLAVIYLVYSNYLDFAHSYKILFLISSGLAMLFLVYQDRLYQRKKLEQQIRDLEEQLRQLKNRLNEVNK